MDIEQIEDESQKLGPQETPESVMSVENTNDGNDPSYVNSGIGFSYDTKIIGTIKDDNAYADPNNSEFVWPEGYIRVNHVRWMDTINGSTASDPFISVENFDGTTHKVDVIQFRPDKESYEADKILITPIVKAFIESPFCDASMIDRETQRYMAKIDEENMRYYAFVQSYDPEEQRLFQEWKNGTNAQTANDEPDKENTNFYANTDGTPRSVWELLSEATTEDLFKFKLDIFEQEVVQNSENKELRSKIRKAKSISEVCMYFQMLLNDDGTEQQKPSLLEVIQQSTPEDLFKLKLEIFETEAVQNSENRDLRSKIRKSESVTSVFSAYDAILNDKTS